MTKEQKDIVSRLKKIEDIVLLKNSRTGETKDSSIRDILSKGSSKTIRKDKPTFGIDLKKKQSTIRNDHWVCSWHVVDVSLLSKASIQYDSRWNSEVVNMKTYEVYGRSLWVMISLIP